MVQERISEKLDKLIELLEKTQEKKKFKLPLGIAVQKGKLKKNYVLVILLKTNGQIDFKFLPIENDTVYIKENQTFHLASSDYIFQYKQWPTIILPEWSLEPISPKKLHEEAMKEGKWAYAQKPIIMAITQSEIAAAMKKAKISGGLILLGIIGAIAVLYFISQAFGGK